MSSPLPFATCSISDCILDLSQFGALQLPAESADLHFQIDLVPTECPDQVYFGLVQLDPTNQQPVTGLAIHLDWTSGQVRDALNGFGVLDTLDFAPFALDQIDAEEPLLLSLKIDKCGANLLPTFEVGGKQLLYPAITSNVNTPFTAVAGAAQPGLDIAPFCLHPALWMVAKP